MNNKQIQGYALIVGVGSDLPNTVNDAKGIADILQDQERCGYPPSNITLLVERDATRENILSALNRLTQRSSSDSIVVVYFSGHGLKVSSPFGDLYYLLPYGYKTKQLPTTAINGSEFTEKLRALKAKKLLVLLDCCHAGGISEGKVPGIDVHKAPLPAEAMELLKEGRGTVVISSSTEDELSYAGKPYSAFTLAIIEALCGKGAAKKDGYVRVADVALHTRQVVPVRTGDRQHPILHFEHADNYVVSYYAGGDKDLKSLPFDFTPQIEPTPGAWSGFDQREQVIKGNQTNIAGNAEGPIFSGNFYGPVNTGDDKRKITTDGGAYVEGNVSTSKGGDFVGRDKHNYSINVGDISNNTGIVIGNNSSVQLTGSDRSDNDVSASFRAIYQKVELIKDNEEKDELKEVIQKLEKEARKGELADENRIERWLKFLAALDPDVWETLIKTFDTPVKGVAIVFLKAVIKARNERG